MKDHEMLFTLGGLGALLGLGQMLASQERITLRLAVGRAIVSGGIGLAAGAFLTIFPSLGNVALCGLAATLASVGASGVERLFQKVIGSK